MYKSTAILLLMVVLLVGYSLARSKAMTVAPADAMPSTKIHAEQQAPAKLEPAEQPAQPMPKTPAPAAELPDDLLASLRDSLANDPPPSGEKWSLGPLDDLKEADGHLPSDTELVRPAVNWKTTVRRTRIAKMTIAGEPGIEDAFKRWDDRLTGEIERTEINMAKAALKLAQVASYADKHSMQHGETIGERFRTRAGIMGKNRVEIELFWLDPNNPQAKKAYQEFRSQAPATK